MRTSALLVSALIVLTLTGCQPDDPTIVPQPEPSSTPLFASEEEALAAAEEAFGKYLAVLDSVSADGGTSPERMSTVATPSVVEHETRGMVDMQAHGERTVGSRKFDSMTLQSFDPASSEETVVTYVCEDFTGLDVVDVSGTSVVSPGRQVRYPLAVTFDVNSTNSLWVSGVDDWTGSDFCAG